MKKVFLTLLPLVILLAGAAVLLFFLVRGVEARSRLKVYAQSTSLRDRNGLFLDEVPAPDGQYGYWGLTGPVSTRLSRVIRAAEDKDFYSHPGFNAKAMLRAFYQNVTSGRRVSGASTIAMQVVRLQHPAPRTYWNKLTEALAAAVMVRRSGHEAVLRQYLTIAPFGPNYYGVEYAAWRYFQKPLADLSLSETLLLCAIPKSPARYNLYTLSGREAAVRQALVVLERMRGLGWVTVREYDDAARQLPFMPLYHKETRPHQAIHAILAARAQLPPSRPRVIYSSLDLNLQKKIAALAVPYLARLKSDGAGNTAAVVADLKTGEVLAYLGSADYSDTNDSGMIDYARVLRSAGSTLKPFIYALGMRDCGYTGASVLADVGILYPSGSQIFVPQNSDRLFEGPVLYRYALANSRNIPAVEVLNTAGLDQTFAFLGTLGLVDPSVVQNASWYGLGLSVGGLYVSLYSLVRAYGILGNDGRRFEYTWVRQDETLGAQAREELIPADIARMISIYLSDPAARMPSFARMGSLEYPFAFAVKTGTSLGYRDAWTVGYSRRYVAGVWTGHPSERRMKKLGGSNSSALLLKKIIYLLHPEEKKGQKNIPFLPPEGYISCRICPVTGLLAQENSRYSVTEWFRPGTEPLETSRLFVTLTADTRTGRWAAADCPPQFQMQKMAVDIEPRFAEWAEASGLELTPVRERFDPLRLLHGEPETRLTILEPLDGSRITVDPSIPLQFQTLPLKVSLSQPSGQVVWYVDDKPWQVADYPYTLRWRLQPGRHTFQARMPYSDEQSATVTILVK